MGTIYGFMIDHVAVYVSDLSILGFYVVLHVVKIRNDMKRRGGRTESVPWDPVGNRVLPRPGSLEPLDPIIRTEDDQVCVDAAQVRPEA